MSSALSAGQQARAIYDYEARATDELSFKQGDTIEVVDDSSDPDWWRGRLFDGKEGVFPRAYCEEDA